MTIKNLVVQGRNSVRRIIKAARRLFVHDTLYSVRNSSSPPKTWQDKASLGQYRQWSYSIDSTGVVIAEENGVHFGPLVNASFASRSQFVVLSNGLKVDFVKIKGSQFSPAISMPRHHDAFVRILEVSLEGTLVLVGCPKHVEMYEAKYPERKPRIHEPPGLTDPITCAAFSPDSRHFHEYAWRAG